MREKHRITIRLKPEQAIGLKAVMPWGAQDKVIRHIVDKLVEAASADPHLIPRLAQGRCDIAFS